MDICGKQQLYLFGAVALLSQDDTVVMVVFVYQVRILSMVIVSYQSLYQCAEGLRTLCVLESHASAKPKAVRSIAPRYNTDTSNAHLANVIE